MKRPRINDFDPNTAPPLGSPMDDLPSIQKPMGDRVENKAQQDSSAGRQPSPIAPDVRAYGRTASHRVVKRYAFEFYQDQLDTLRHFSLEEKLRGEKGNMSEMVRAALDEYIRKRQQDRS